MPRPKKTSLDWKTRIKNACPCFVTLLSKPEPSKEACILPCNLKDLKEILLQHEQPTRKQIVRAMLKAGIFKKQEIIGALQEIDEMIYKTAARRIEETIKEMENEGYNVFPDDLGNLQVRE